MALSMTEIRTYADTLNDLISQARGDLIDMADELGWNLNRQEVAQDLRLYFANLMEQYGNTCSELGAQWYELCASRANVSVDAALLKDINFDRIDARLQRRLRDYIEGTEDYEIAMEFVVDLLEDELRNSAREQVIYNLDRDERAARRGSRTSTKSGYARVPVGDTCAWCIMLASRGYVYRSYESAGGLDPDHYHAHCDCVVVGYNDPINITGYEDRYSEYLSMYETARDAWQDNAVSDELAERISAAKEKHEIEYAEGKVTKPWAEANEIAIIMRDRYGLDH